MICPKCGYENVPADECPRCGVIASRYLAAMAPAEGGRLPVIHVDAVERPRRWPMVVVGLLALMALGALAWRGLGGSAGEPRKDTAVRAGRRGAATARHGRPVPAPEPALSSPPAEPPAEIPPPSYVSSTWYSGASGYERARLDQKDYGAPMAVYFYTDWCPYCKQLDRNILHDSEAERYLDGVVKVRINPDEGDAEKALAARFGVTGYPSFFMIPARGGQTRVGAYTRAGGGWRLETPGEFVAFCRRAGGS